MCKGRCDAIVCRIDGELDRSVQNILSVHRNEQEVFEQEVLLPLSHVPDNSSCHQKLYLPWIPPSTADLSVYRQYKTILRELSKLTEAAAKHDLAGRLDGGRRSIPPDSTVGVSLSGLTEPAGMGTQILIESQANF